MVGDRELGCVLVVSGVVGDVVVESLVSAPHDPREYISYIYGRQQHPASGRAINIIE